MSCSQYRYANTLAVLAIHGTDDDAVPYSHVDRLADNCPTAKLLGIEGGEHVVVFTHLSSIRRAVESSANDHS